MSVIRWGVLSALLILFPSTLPVQPVQCSIEQMYLRNAHIEEINGVKVLFVEGSYHDIGYQHGYLLRDEVRENVRAIISYEREMASYGVFFDLWNVTKECIPDQYLSEMQGIADGADISLDELGVSYMIVPFIDMGCFSYAAWRNATKDGKLYHVRSLDFPIVIKDPQTGKCIQENSVLIVRKPENGLISVVPTIAGWINFYEGFNERNISITIQACWSTDQKFEGIPIQFRLQMALDSASTIEDAMDIMLSKRMLGWNFVISDGKTAYAVEVTANHSYVGSWDDPVENITPFWKIKEVVRRTNFFVDPEIASTQRKLYDPSGLKGFIATILGSPFFPIWRKYKSVSEEIEDNWGKIDINSSISILRRVYGGEVDFVLFFFQLLSRGRGILCDFHQWSYCPSSGEFVISFADSQKRAHETSLHYLNIKDLIKQAS